MGDSSVVLLCLNGQVNQGGNILGSSLVNRSGKQALDGEFYARNTCI